MDKQALIIQCMDYLSLPSNLDGSNGSNRSTETNRMIKVDNDVDAIRIWLSDYTESKHTFSSYRKESERLLLWSIVELGKPLSSLDHEDFVKYRKFIANPRPISKWVMLDSKYPRNHENWKPFTGGLSESSQRQCLVILNGLFSWLVNVSYLKANPLSLLKNRRSNTVRKNITRYLDPISWRFVKETIDLMPQKTLKQREHYNRTRWLFVLLYLTGMRISEVCNNYMGHFKEVVDIEEERSWWLEVIGKGNKTREIPATEDLIKEMKRYRAYSGLSKYPSEGELTPLIMPIGGRKEKLSRSTVHLLVKNVFNKTVTRLREKGDKYESLAKKVEKASTHWVRHTAATNMANSDMDLIDVRDTLGHEDISTTNAYLHSSDKKRHKEMSRKHKLKW